uniref:Reverse transcriptase zinc-binding domain-containing protein n=1 Tax=Aegilops tauschii subsp. strangulata TaxID=200361 RepID=A0A453RAT1_AEGTS
MQHLLVTCPFSRQVWHDTFFWRRMTCRRPDQDASISEWWLATKALTPKPLRKGLASATLLMRWMF